jgi:DNA-binding CsgD family transcriptional regulator
MIRSFFGVMFVPRMPSLMGMGDSTLVARLRGANGFAEIAAAVIDDLRAVPGVVGVAVEAHVGGEPLIWFSTEPFARGDARRYVDGGFHGDRLLARLREAQVPIWEGGYAIVPIVGCGELVGTIRLIADVAERVSSASLQLVSMLTSVRLAQIGGLGVDAHALTARQHEIAVLVSRGCTNQEIGDMLEISANAVKKHVSRALEVLGVSNRTELAALAGRWNGPPTERLSPAISVVRAERPNVSARAA